MSSRNRKCCWDATDWLPSEVIYWLNVPSFPPVWSRLSKNNSANVARCRPESKCGVYDIEIPNELWSLWGYLHPLNEVFNPKACDKHSWACNIVACCAAKLYPLAHWKPHLLDSIVINGDRYYYNSLRKYRGEIYQFTLHDLCDTCCLDNLRFKVHTEIFSFGALYEHNNSPIKNLAKSLINFFSQHKVGLLHCRHLRAVVIGRDNCNGCVGGDYFMFDCQSKDYPLFGEGDCRPYLLRCKTLQMLLYCIVMALEVRCKRVQFALHKVSIRYDGPILEDQDENELKKLQRVIVSRKEKPVNAGISRIRNICKSIQCPKR
nr:uncharacterized protein LOC118681159 [Bactrocera oleae]